MCIHKAKKKKVFSNDVQTTLTTFWGLIGNAGLLVFCFLVTCYRLMIFLWYQPIYSIRASDGNDKCLVRFEYKETYVISNETSCQSNFGQIKFADFPHSTVRLCSCQNETWTKEIENLSNIQKKMEQKRRRQIFQFVDRNILRCGYITSQSGNICIARMLFNCNVCTCLHINTPYFVFVFARTSCHFIWSCEIELYLLFPTVYPLWFCMPQSTQTNYMTY